MQDVRLALRLLRKSPVFTATAVLTLALGLGANTSIFSIAYAAILRPLPYAEPERLLIVRDMQDANETSVSYPEYRDWRERSAGIAEIGAYAGAAFTVGGSDPLAVSGQRASASLWRVLGVRPVLGRLFTDEEDGAGAERVVLISHGLWQRRYNGDPEVVGRTILLDDVPYTVVGVLPQGFRGVLPRDGGAAMPRDVWISLQLTDQNAPRGLHFLTVVARVRPGVTLDRARDHFATIAASLRNDRRTEHGIVTRPVVEYVASGSRDVLLTLAAAFAGILLIATANLANLLVARAAGRRTEVAVRLALGATRSRIARQFLVEGVTLTIFGGALGLFVAYGVLRWFVATEPLTGINPDLVVLNAPALGFSLTIALVSGLLVGSVPAWQALRSHARGLLSSGLRSASGAGGRLRSAVVVFQLATAVVLLVSAGLLSLSLLRLLAVDKGFDASSLVTFDLALSREMAREPERQAQTFEEILGRITGIPGVERAVLVDSLPFGGGGVSGHVPIEGRAVTDARRATAEKRIVSAGYFDALRIPVTQGRDFTDDDRHGTTPVAVVSEAFARRHLPHEDPIGRRIQFAWGTEDTQVIVGVVGDVRHEGLDVPPEPTVYVSYLQRPSTALAVLIESTRAPADLRATVQDAVRRTDPTRPVPLLRRVNDLIGASLEPRRVSVIVAAAFAALALTLACLGVYGVISFAAASRTREIGIRVAVGATPGEVLSLVMKQGVVLTGVGLALGIGGSLAAARLLRSHLFATSPADPVMIASAAAILGLGALAATLVPARRASRTDPVRALRDESV
jgi:putative ABC transport system permease protein